MDLSDKLLQSLEGMHFVAVRNPPCHLFDRPPSMDHALLPLVVPPLLGVQSRREAQEQQATALRDVRRAMRERWEREQARATLAGRRLALPPDVVPFVLSFLPPRPQRALAARCCKGWFLAAEKVVRGVSPDGSKGLFRCASARTQLPPPPAAA